MARALPAWIALALLPLGGCAVDGDAAGESLLEIAGPEAFERFELRDEDDQVIWGLVANEPAPLARLVYGDVPPGFRQETPADGGAPRELIAGEPLTLESVTPRRVFHHEGFADGGRRLSIDRWRMQLRARQEPPWPATDQSAGAPAKEVRP